MAHPYLRCFFAVSISLYCLFEALSIYFQPIVGDLTRVGGYSERDFGWNNTQPVIKIVYSGSRLIEPDVLVLGDSFSIPNIWQSILTKRLKRTFLSFDFGRFGCTDNWVDYAMFQSSAKTIIIETIERYSVPRFAKPSNCNNRTPAALEVTEKITPETRPRWPPEWHAYHTLRVAMNTLRMQMDASAILQGDPNVPDHEINAPMKNRCRGLFSNRRADRLLYDSGDEQKQLWAVEDQVRAVTRVVEIQKAIERQGKRFVFVVIPDKLSIYQDCLLNDPDGERRRRVNVIERLIAAGVNTPDLLRAFEREAARRTDFYYPNDTHLSSEGYTFLAESLVPWLGGP